MYGSYGGGMSSYGGGYGGSYGSSYGSYGGSMGGGYGGYGMNRMGQQNQQNGNPENNQQQPNGRRQFMEEYFKMMGGLRSMVDFGFALIALGQFSSHSWKILKKILGFLAKTSQSMGSKIMNFMKFDNSAGKAMKKILLIPNNPSGASLQNKVLIGLKIFGIIAMAICMKLKEQIKKEAEAEHEQILKEFDEVKSELDRIQREKENSLVHLKEGYF